MAFIGLHFANGDNRGLPWEAAQSRTHYCLMELSPTNCIWRPLPLEWPRYRFKFWGNVSYYLCQNVKEGDFWDNCMIDQSDLTEHDITWPWPLAIEEKLVHDASWYYWFLKMHAQPNLSEDLPFMRADIQTTLLHINSRLLLDSKFQKRKKRTDVVSPWTFFSLKKTIGD